MSGEHYPPNSDSKGTKESRVYMSRSNSGWSNWGDHPVVVMISLIAAVIGIIAFFIDRGNKQFINSNQETHDNVKSHSSTEVSSAPPDVEVPILRKEDLFDSYDKPNSGCYPEGNYHTVTVKKAENDGIMGPDDTITVILRDYRGVHGEYYLGPDLHRTTRGWIPSIMVPGRRLKIQYVRCGSGGFKHLTYIETLRASK